VVSGTEPTVNSAIINNGRPINANANHGTYPYNPTNETAVPVAGHVSNANSVTITAESEYGLAVGGGAAATATPDANGNFYASFNLFSVADGNVIFTIVPKEISSVTVAGDAFTTTVVKDTWIPRIQYITSDATTPGVLAVGDTITFTATLQDVPTPDLGETITGNYNEHVLSFTQTTMSGSFSTWQSTYTVQAGDQSPANPVQITGLQAIDGAGNESDPNLSLGSFYSVDSGTDVQKTIDAHLNQPITKEQCMNNGWKTLGDTQSKYFKNQGNCIAFVASEGRK
jgi:hypothetical protein